MTGTSDQLEESKLEAVYSRFPADVPGLLNALRKLKADNPKACRSTVHAYPSAVYAPELGPEGDRKITSWKMTEHMYFKSDNGFPTLARGLFTEEVDSAAAIPPTARSTYGEDSEVKERIVARGYDKFFNTGEMAWTNVSLRWSAVLTPSGPLSRRIPSHHIT